MEGCPTVCARARQAARGTSSVNSFLIHRGLARGIFIQKKAIPFGVGIAFLAMEACCILVREPLLGRNNCNQYHLRAIEFSHISTKNKGIVLI